MRDESTSFGDDEVANLTKALRFVNYHSGAVILVILWSVPTTTLRVVICDQSAPFKRLIINNNCQGMAQVTVL